MKITHGVQMVVATAVPDELCKQKIVDYILDGYPDAIVDGPPVIRPWSFKDTYKQVSQTFESPMYNKVAADVVESILRGLDSMRYLVNGDSDWKEGYNTALEQVAEHLERMLGEDHE